MKCRVDQCPEDVTAKRPLCRPHWLLQHAGKLGACEVCATPIVEGTRCSKHREAKKPTTGDRLTATQLGNLLGLKGYGVNEVMTELGWLKDRELTALGKRMGGITKEHQASGKKFVLWPAAIAENQAFLRTMKRMSLADDGAALMLRPGEVAPVSAPAAVIAPTRDAGEFVADDGHFVRSKSLQRIDDWLFAHEVVHAYERALPGHADVKGDFFVPRLDLWIEFWGHTTPAQKKSKQAVFRELKLKVIEIEPGDMEHLEQILDRVIR